MRLFALAMAAACAIPSLRAQDVRVGLHGVYATNTELNERRGAGGAGIGGLLAGDVGRFGLELSGYMVSLSAEEPQSALQDYKVRQGDARASVLVTPSVAIQFGAGRRSVDPELAAQDVGFLRVGLASENRLSNISNLRVRGAYLLAPRFSGGGNAGLAFEIGLGVGIGRQDGRVRFEMGYDFQRIDRQVNDVDVPIQSMVARVGAAVGL
jgi:hypothetical protein